MFLDLIGRHANSIRQLLIRFSPRRRISRVDGRKLFATIKTFSYFIDSDSSCFHLPPSTIQLLTGIICSFWWSFVAKRLLTNPPGLIAPRGSCAGGGRVRGAALSRL